MLLWIKLLNVTEMLHLTTQQLVSCITSVTFNNSSQVILQVVYSVIDVWRFPCMAALWNCFCIINILELQLKDHHQPLRLRMKWPELLKRFTTATTEMIEKGESN